MAKMGFSGDSIEIFKISIFSRKFPKMTKYWRGGGSFSPFKYDILQKPLCIFDFKIVV